MLYLLNEDTRATAAADSRDEGLMSAIFSDAYRKLADEIERREQSLTGSHSLRATLKIYQP